MLSRHVHQTFNKYGADQHRDRGVSVVFVFDTTQPSNDSACYEYAREHVSEAPTGRKLSAAGDHAKGEFRCTDCGYAITVCRELPPCAMCGCETWQAGLWRPFGRALESSLH